MKCDRCKRDCETVTGSYFNTEIICLVCEGKEMEHPKYKEAKAKEHEEVKKGNYNYEGIGKPKDL